MPARPDNATDDGASGELKAESVSIFNVWSVYKMCRGTGGEGKLEKLVQSFVDASRVEIKSIKITEPTTT